ncbi:cytochrome P450 [Massarina eburnea CBS 473.64]|uniref:Cytochrome P450 n=1 Tax=Massarina eburnea CBS 473.64 TaxID=1395130 RepID=A0A6A6SCI9_9PLEO|nr:cytochrome P450 [Massarina eburnea CBS 473.64]
MIFSDHDQRLRFFNNFLDLIPSPLLYPILAIASVLLTFRIWRFTIRPWFHPQEPRELPYWIPYLGHTIPYLWSGHHVVMRAQKYFKNTREPFSITLIDRTIYFILHPDDTAEAYKNTTTMVFDKIVQNLQLMFGISKHTMERVWLKPTSKEEDVMAQDLGLSNPGLKSLGELSMDFWRTQLVGQEGYKNAETKLLHYIDEVLADQVKRADATTGGALDLSRFTREVLVGAATRAFFGTKLFEIEPDFVELYCAFDAESWKLWFKWPFAKGMWRNKAKVEEALRTWIRLPREEREGMSYIVDMVEQSQKAVGTSEDDLVKIMNLLVFVINTNTYKACYWALAHLFNDPNLLSIIRSETASALSSSGTLDTQYLRDSTPWTVALFNEALRFYSASSSIRLAWTPTRIGNMIIPAKSVVFIPFRPNHFTDPFSTTSYTNDVHIFNPERFVKDKKLATSQIFRPFSGGSSYCPGRVMARQEVVAFITLLLGKYEVEVLGDANVPETQKRVPAKGFLKAKEGQDMKIRIGRR